tara:strand:- start:895 stop:1767 length:873 start_codon:yes stop_codon:yes gene_type:complete
MKKIIILIPVYNDWDSLEKLIFEINENVKELKKIDIECLIINDSSTIQQPKLFKPFFIKSIQILNMKKNKGHARCNAFGIRYVIKNKNFDYLILMDSDGEDRPIELKKLINKILENPNKSVVAKRIKRSEGPFFQFLYFMHKIITFIFTGKKINFGNYSCLTRSDVEILSNTPSLWSSFSGTVKKSIKKLNEVNSIRGLRYFGPSKMSLFNLLIHSFSIIGVFKYNVFFRSILMIFALTLFYDYFYSFSISLQIIIIFFNLIIFITSLREKKDGLFKSQENLDSIKEISQ